MDDVVADDRGRSDGLGMAGRLNEFDLVAFGVQHGEPAASVGALFNLSWRLPGFGGRGICACLRRLGIPCGVVEAIDAGAGGKWKHLNELRGAEGVADAQRILGIGELGGADDLACNSGR